MTDAENDPWAAWLSRRRHGGDLQMLRRMLDQLAPVRDRVIAGAHLRDGGAVLDVGCGDGLIAFAAAGVVGASGTVIFSDISAALLDQCRQIATDTGMVERCRFVRAPAGDLAPIADGSVDAVTLRSVLIYESDKRSAFAEFHRVLRPGGWLSLFEPINRFAEDHDRAPGRFLGRDLTAVADIVAKLKAVYEAIQPPGTDPMLDFDERDLIRLAESAGFTELHLRLAVDIAPSEPMPWDTVVNASGNPRIPTLAEAMHQALTDQETARLIAELRPQIESGLGDLRAASAYLTARRA